MNKIFLSLLLSIFWVKSHAITCKTEICKSVKNGNTIAVEKILKSNPKSINSKMEYGVSLLHIATINKDVSMIETLLKNKININAQDAGGATAMHITARNSCIQCFEILNQYNASPDIQDIEGLTPIMRAILIKNNNIIPYFLTSKPRCGLISKAGYTLKTIKLAKLQKSIRRQVEAYLKICQ